MREPEKSERSNPDLSSSRAGAREQEIASTLTVTEAKELIAKWRGREQHHAEQQHANEAAIGDDRGQRAMRSLCKDAVEDIADLIACYASASKPSSASSSARVEQREETAFGVELIHQPIPDVEGTEPRLNGTETPHYDPCGVDIEVGSGKGGYPCPQQKGHSGPHGNDRSRFTETARDQEVYFIEVEKNGCERCGHGKQWTVVGPDGVAIGQSFEDEEIAADIAEYMNQGYRAGCGGE